jgi:hypothetical protein
MNLCLRNVFTVPAVVGRELGQLGKYSIEVDAQTVVVN